MAEVVKFGQIKKDKNKGKKLKSKFLYPPRDNDSIVVRLVGYQQKMYQEWDLSTRKYSFLENDNGATNTVCRVVSLALDKSDSQIKAFICPISVFQQMGEHSPDHDFKITRKGRGMQTRYLVESLGKSEVAEGLKSRIDFTLQAFSLTDIFVKNVKWELQEDKPDIIEDRFSILDL